MQYGICPLSIVPVRAEAKDSAEMTTQLLYGDVFEVISHQKKWLKIRIAYDGYLGWIDAKQATEISENEYHAVMAKPFHCCPEFIEYVKTKEEHLLPIFMGSCLAGVSLLGHVYEGNSSDAAPFKKSDILQVASLFLNAPYLWGGKSPFGIDCSGFTQLVYRLCGVAIYRDAAQQATQGNTLSFIEESEPGDLAFFDNEEGKIIHVGILLGENYIIHAHGKVRIDKLDHTGIFSLDTQSYSHQLRVIKQFDF